MWPKDLMSAFCIIFLVVPLCPVRWTMIIVLIWWLFFRSRIFRAYVSRRIFQRCQRFSAVRNDGNDERFYQLYFGAFLIPRSFVYTYSRGDSGFAHGWWSTYLFPCRSFQWLWVLLWDIWILLRVRFRLYVPESVLFLQMDICCFSFLREDSMSEYLVPIRRSAWVVLSSTSNSQYCFYLCSISVFFFFFFINICRWLFAIVSAIGLIPHFICLILWIVPILDWKYKGAKFYGERPTYFFEFNKSLFKIIFTYFAELTSNVYIFT